MKETYLNAKSWPFIEAKKILTKINNKPPQKGYVLFATGYGPSGLPHIGTFGEVARSSMVKYAFEQLSNIPTKLICFSDDLDGLRKVPTNVPNQDLLQANLNKPLTQVPDPFGKFNSFGEHNNAMLQDFLNTFGFDYTFYSATQVYKSGGLDNALLRVLEKYDEVLELMLKNVGEERQKTYSPFLPICKDTGEVLQTKVVSTNFKEGTIVYLNKNNQEVETKVTGGACKLQWKVDWASRWYALEVDYEMSGKDLIHSVEVATKLSKILGKPSPVCFTYEHFLDKEGAKISKSKGNGLSIEEWLKYGNNESLSYFMYQKPQTAKRLFFEMIPKSIDDWLSSLSKYNTLTPQEKAESPLFFIHKNNPPQYNADITFGTLINLVSVVNTSNKDLLWSFVNKYYPNLPQDSTAIIDNLLNYCITYYNDFVKPTINYKILDDKEKQYLQMLATELSKIANETVSANVQQVVYNVGKQTDLALKDWFLLLYQALLGQNQGPRIGSFFALYGVLNSVELINNTINKQ